MTFQFKNKFAVLALASVFLSCSDDDSTNISGTGNLDVEFDNAFASNDLILGAANTQTTSGEILKLSSVKYIVSNIVLTAEDGTTFTYPKSDSYFIVNESDENSLVIDLQNIPAANYTKIKFGIGVDESQFNLGESGQGAFLNEAQNSGLFTDWTSGYKFLLLNGTFTTATNTSDTNFSVQTGKTDTAYNYTEVTLNLPEKALVRTTITPEIHVIADLSKVFNGTNTISLSANPTIANGAAVTQITTNLNSVFSVAHVHND